ncbi:hypothetical protein JXA32_16440, partial [Candidatus Sumerlaeota bacterium]|nr:hypothetical protein [Candidatus Sumerlaeota bacterium]
MAIALKPTTAKEYSWLTRNARARQQRTMAEFAEQEIRIPDEPGLPRYRIDSQPSIRHWFEAVDSGRYERHWGTGCTQSGKTLSCVVIPAMYHLFEIGETVIVGLPSMEMAGDKWREDFEPAIRASRYRDL